MPDAPHVSLTSWRSKHVGRVDDQALMRPPCCELRNCPTVARLCASILQIPAPPTAVLSQIVVKRSQQHTHSAHTQTTDAYLLHTNSNHSSTCATKL